MKSPMSELEKHLLGSMVLGIIAIVACNTPTILTPKIGAGTSYPCGVNGVVCTTQHMCCGEEETCGGEPASVGCPKGMCCFVGSGEFGQRRPPVIQWPQH